MKRLICLALTFAALALAGCESEPAGSDGGLPGKDATSAADRADAAVPADAAIAQPDAGPAGEDAAFAADAADGGMPEDPCVTASVPLQVGTPTAGDTRGGPEALACDTEGDGAPEVLHSFVADATGGTYNVAVLSEDGHALVIYATTDCFDPDATTHCTGPGMDLGFELDVAAGATAFVVVDGLWGEAGFYTITVEKVAKE